MRRALVAVTILAGLAGGCGGSDPVHRRVLPGDRLDVLRVDMGVSCPRPNSIRCDRVGLAVWLARRPERLEASIAGRPLRLRWRVRTTGAEYGISRHRYVHLYEGFLSPAGLIHGPLRVRAEGGRYHWTGATPVTAKVRLTARFPDGRRQRRTLNVGLAAGWG